MVYEIVFVIVFMIALIGSSVAGWFDLKTTEIPDEIPALMSALGIFIWYMVSLDTGNMNYLWMSLAVGIVFLAFGWMLYQKGQWGGGDAKLLAAIGFLMPSYFETIWIFHFDLLPFSLTYVLNLFVVGALYMIVYALIIGFRQRAVFRHFLADVKKNMALLILASLGFTLMLSLVFYLLIGKLGFVVFNLFALTFLIALFWRYAKCVEQYAFTKKIPVKELREGDVIVESKVWDGLTKEEVARIQKHRKFVTIKEGVRFAPSFPLALLVTLLFGNVLLTFIIL